MEKEVSTRGAALRDAPKRPLKKEMPTKRLERKKGNAPEKTTNTSFSCLFLPLSSRLETHLLSVLGGSTDDDAGGGSGCCNLDGFETRELGERKR